MVRHYIQMCIGGLLSGMIVLTLFEKCSGLSSLAEPTDLHLLVVTMNTMIPQQNPLLLCTAGA